MVYEVFLRLTSTFDRARDVRVVSKILYFGFHDYGTFVRTGIQEILEKVNPFKPRKEKMGITLRKNMGHENRPRDLPNTPLSRSML